MSTLEEETIRIYRPTESGNVRSSDKRAAQEYLSKKYGDAAVLVSVNPERHGGVTEAIVIYELDEEES
jgi:hypothetical protein